MNNPSIGFIGAGRVATGLALALAHAQRAAIVVHSRAGANAQRLANLVAGCRVVGSPQEVVDIANLVFIAVPDDVIEPLARSLRWPRGTAAIHCSGALGLEVLQAPHEQGAAIGAFHPLQLFPDAAVTSETSAAALLRDSAIAIEASQPLREQLESLAQSLGARTLQVAPGARAAYHAGSHYAAAFVCVLLAEAQAIFERIGIDADAASWGLQALARGTLDAVRLSDPARAMAGAYARGDIGTAVRHLQAMDNLGAETGVFYRELARRSVTLALQAGRIDESRAASLRKLLAEPLAAAPVHSSGSAKT